MSKESITSRSLHFGSNEAMDMKERKARESKVLQDQDYWANSPLNADGPSSISIEDIPPDSLLIVGNFRSPLDGPRSRQ